jgi:hypothetical protein
LHFYCYQMAKSPGIWRVSSPRKIHFSSQNYSSCDSNWIYGSWGAFWKDLLNDFKLGFYGHLRFWYDPIDQICLPVMAQPKNPSMSLFTQLPHGHYPPKSLNFQSRAWWYFINQKFRADKGLIQASPISIAITKASFHDCLVPYRLNQIDTDQLIHFLFTLSISFYYYDFDQNFEFFRIYMYMHHFKMKLKFHSSNMNLLIEVNFTF